MCRLGHHSKTLWPPPVHGKLLHMSVPGLLLRALLCLALVLNGAGFAVAGAGMPMQQAPAAPSGAATAHAHCMEATSAAGTGAISLPTEHDGTPADCCGDNTHCSKLTCALACAAGAVPAALATAMPGFEIGLQATHLPSAAAEAPAPALPTRHRPPIV